MPLAHSRTLDVLQSYGDKYGKNSSHNIHYYYDYDYDYNCHKCVNPLHVQTFTIFIIG